MAFWICLEYTFKTKTIGLLIVSFSVTTGRFPPRSSFSGSLHAVTVEHKDLSEWRRGGSLAGSLTSLKETYNKVLCIGIVLRTCFFLLYLYMLLVLQDGEHNDILIHGRQLEDCFQSAYFVRLDNKLFLVENSLPKHAVENHMPETKHQKMWPGLWYFTCQVFLVLGSTSSAVKIDSSNDIHRINIKPIWENMENIWVKKSVKHDLNYIYNCKCCSFKAPTWHANATALFDLMKPLCLKGRRKSQDAKCTT